jgi:hypothetical protein
MQTLAQAHPGPPNEGENAMTTMTMNTVRAPIFAAPRAPKLSTAQWRAKLSDLSAPVSLTGTTTGIVLRAALAVIPFATLAWLFVSV